MPIQIQGRVGAPLLDVGTWKIKKLQKGGWDILPWKGGSWGKFTILAEGKSVLKLLFVGT